MSVNPAEIVAEEPEVGPTAHPVVGRAWQPAEPVALSDDPLAGFQKPQ